MAFDPNKITYFAKTDARGKNVQFGIKAKDRQRHMYIIGKTGMGKSTLLENMAVQDIQNGEGMAFIDPHGSAAETLLNYIPEHRVKDVVYFSPFDTDHPISFNIMEDVGPDKRHLVVSGLMSVFKKIFVDAWSARMEYILSNTILALLEYPDSTLLGVNRMLSDKVYRNLVVDHVKDPGVKAFWVDEFAKYNERYMQEAGDAIKNKIGQFSGNPVIRNIIGQPKSSFDIRQMMDEKKILIINLSKGLIGESNANLLGSMITTRIYLAAMSRADLSPERMREMPNFYFYVDEFQSFANATFANILSEARKYHLNLTIAHQYVTQMEEEVRDAVFGNVGTIISFRVGPLDAELLETIFTPQFLSADIVNLGYTQIYLTLMIDGIGSQPFSAMTLPPIAPPHTSFKELAIATSREQFTRPRADVEADIHKFHEPVVAPKKEERRERPETAPLTPRPQREYERPRTEARPTPPRENRESEKPRTVVRERVAPVMQTPSPIVVDIPQPVPSEVRVPPEPKQEPKQEQEQRKEPRPEPKPLLEPTPEAPEVQKPIEQRKPREYLGAPRPEKPKQPHPKRAPQQVEDLRSVLKRLVDTPKENEKSTLGATEKKSSEGNRNELKAVLNTVIHHDEESKENMPLRENPERDTAQQASDETPASKVYTQDISASRTEAPQPPQNSVSEKSAGNSMPTPKELERMMRVTTSDRPPLA